MASGIAILLILLVFALVYGWDKAKDLQELRSDQLSTLSSYQNEKWKNDKLNDDLNRIKKQLDEAQKKLTATKDELTEAKSDYDAAVAGRDDVIAEARREWEKLYETAEAEWVDRLIEAHEKHCKEIASLQAQFTIKLEDVAGQYRQSLKEISEACTKYSRSIAG